MRIEALFRHPVPVFERMVTMNPKVTSVCFASVILFHAATACAAWITCDWAQRNQAQVIWGGDFSLGAGSFGVPLVQGEWKGAQGPWQNSLSTNWTVNPNGWGAQQPSFAQIFVRGRMFYFDSFGIQRNVVSGQLGAI
jgi:hypothetical protein